MNIVSICGSLRRASNTRIIESVLQSLAPAGMRARAKTGTSRCGR
jgi:NAD(P)H-dependent FMN reductase